MTTPQGPLPKNLTSPATRAGWRNYFDCPACHALSLYRGVRTTAMIETVSAFFGVISAGIFLAHAFESYSSR
jgi:hypothetical protein